MTQCSLAHGINVAEPQISISIAEKVRLDTLITPLREMSYMTLSA